MTHLDLFAGFGGWALAAHTVWLQDYEPIAFCEIDSTCIKELRRCWPGVRIHKDICVLNGKKYKGIDIITGSPPCQPYSKAGKRGGSKDDRALWPQMFRIVQEANPRWVCIENVDGIIAMELNTILDDLESEDFETQAFLIPAAAIGASHIRYRCWIIAHANGTLKQIKTRAQIKSASIGREKWLVVERNPWSRSFGGIRSLVDGLPQWSKELKALGNSIVPQIPLVIFEAIKEIDGCPI